MSRPIGFSNLTCTLHVPVVLLLYMSCLAWEFMWRADVEVQQYLHCVVYLEEHLAEKFGADPIIWSQGVNTKVHSHFLACLAALGQARGRATGKGALKQ